MGDFANADPIVPLVHLLMHLLRAAVKAKLLVGKYPLQTIVSRFSPCKDATCLLCDLEAETRAHFLLHCNKLQAARQPWMEKILLHHNIDQIPRREEDVEKLGLLYSRPLIWS